MVPVWGGGLTPLQAKRSGGLFGRVVGASADETPARAFVIFALRHALQRAAPDAAVVTDAVKSFALPLVKEQYAVPLLRTAAAELAAAAARCVAARSFEGGGEELLVALLGICFGPTWQVVLQSAKSSIFASFNTSSAQGRCR